MEAPSGSLDAAPTDGWNGVEPLTGPRDLFSSVPSWPRSRTYADRGQAASCIAAGRCLGASAAKPWPSSPQRTRPVALLGTTAGGRCHVLPDHEAPWQLDNQPAWRGASDGDRPVVLGSLASGHRNLEYVQPSLAGARNRGRQRSTRHQRVGSVRSQPVISVAYPQIARSASLPSGSARVHQPGAWVSLTIRPPAATAASIRARTWSYGT
jgi:hypothetical protein